MKSSSVTITCPLCKRSGCDVYEFASGEIGLKRHYVGLTRNPCLVKRDDPQVIVAYKAARELKVRADAARSVLSAIGNMDRLPIHARAREAWLAILYGNQADSALADAKKRLSEAYDRHYSLSHFHRLPYEIGEYRDEIASHPDVVAAMFWPVLKWFASPEFWAYVLLNEAQSGKDDAIVPPLSNT